MGFIVQLYKGTGCFHQFMVQKCTVSGKTCMGQVHCPHAWCKGMQKENPKGCSHPCCSLRCQQEMGM